jgi:hypothetical protein
MQELHLQAGREPHDPQPGLTDAHVRLEVRAAALAQPPDRDVLAGELEARGLAASGATQRGPRAGGSDVAHAVEEHEEIVRPTAARGRETLETAEVHAAWIGRPRARLKPSRDGA